MGVKVAKFGGSSVADKFQRKSLQLIRTEDTSLSQRQVNVLIQIQR